MPRNIPSQESEQDSENRQVQSPRFDPDDRKVEEPELRVGRADEADFEPVRASRHEPADTDEADLDEEVELDEEVDLDMRATGGGPDA